VTSDGFDKRKALLLAARISIRAVSIISFAVPPLFLYAQLAKSVEGGIHAIATLRKAKKINLGVMFEAGTHAAPALIRLYHIRGIAEKTWGPTVKDFASKNLEPMVKNFQVNTLQPLVTRAVAHWTGL